MLKTKSPKSSKMRGSSSHGRGFKKRARGSGNRGGFGRAGTGRGADSKHQQFSKKFGKSYFGKKGFTSVSKSENKTISLKALENSLNMLIEKKLIELKGDLYIIDLKKIGFDKVLSNGNLTKKLEIKNGLASKKAIEKIEKLSGKVILADN